VVTVAPETPLREVAKTLLTHSISEKPVVDGSGSLIGMVSEGDLVGRKKTERETRSEWWLQRLAEGEPLNTEFLAHLQSPLAVAKEVMSSPVLAVSEDTSTDEIADLMAVHNVKRLPVLREGKIVGIVRRSDLLRAMSGGKFEPVPRPPEPGSITEEIQETNGTPFVEEQGKKLSGVADIKKNDFSAADFRHLVLEHHDQIDLDRAHHRAEIQAQRRRDLQRLIRTHISADGWRDLIHAAHEAAERGETEFLLLRFPSQLCSDDGRAVNAPDPEWPRTLRGEAAEMYLRWERELRPRGFHLTARVLEFPEGVPGDIGLFLSWAG
jgi:CBS-domain-containing membrane protein